MSRWHFNDCSGPDIDVSEDGVPLCRVCQASPNVEEIVREIQELSELRTEDTSIISTNLSWPASLPWTHNEGPALQSTLVDATVDEHDAAAVSLASTFQKTILDDYEPSNDAMASAVYNQRLITTQLRLLRLDPMETPNRDMPLHVTLEIHELDDCPEYEAVSYTWAGESGNSIPCKPIYVGPYWDVLIQTENCHSMLRDLRPRRHHAFRRLWVDAICINQNDVLERDRQVSRMGDIYRNCMRVVVYLPVEHLRSARPIETGRVNRPRTRLTREILLELLRTRYFTRVWIIQELILAPTVVFHLKDEDVCFSPSGLDVDWGRTKASWVAHMADPKAFGKLRLIDVLERTWHSKAADARDRIFGVLGLLPGDAVSRLRLEPNYSLSARDVFIGAVAYMILVERQMFLLARATGIDHAPLGYPSWFPDLHRQPSPFTPTDLFSPRVPKSWTGFSSDIRFSHSGLYHFHSRSPVYFGYGHGIGSICKCRYGGLTDRGHPFIQNSIDSATGALSLDCIRIFQEPMHPVDTVTHNPTWYQDSVTFTKRIANSEGLILWEWRSRGAILRITASSSGNAEEDYLRENCCLFIAGQFGGTPTLLFLRPEANTTSASFHLKLAYPIVGMSLFVFRHESKYMESLITSTDTEFSRLCGNLAETLSKIRGLSALTLNEFADKSRLKSQRTEDRFIMEDMLSLLFPGEGVVLQDILPVLSRLCDEKYQSGKLHDERGKSVYWENFLERYENFLKTKCPELQPSLSEVPGDDPRDWISFKYTKERWSKLVDQDGSPKIVLNAHYQDLLPIGPRPRHESINFTQNEHLDEIIVEIELRLWCVHLLHLDILQDLKRLRKFKTDGTKAVSQCRPKERDVYVHPLPREATDELGLLWKHETVTIV